MDLSATVIAALDPARAMDPGAYSLGGRAPAAALRPTSAEEVAEALKAAARDRLAVVPWGAGTKIARERPPDRYDVALDLTSLDRVVEHDPEDLTLTAQCGATLASLRATLAARGQELPLESPGAPRATLGGILATNAAGPRRLRFGSPRDRILGARFALADGTIARSGGKVVKNVAGFALHRLLCGSRGGLGVILEASLKLMPAPEHRVALAYGATREQMADAGRWAFIPRLEPAFVSVLGRAAAEHVPDPARTAAAYTVAIGLEDDAAWVAQQERAVAGALGDPASRIEGNAVVTLAQALADAESHATPRIVLTSAHKSPAALAPLLDRPGAERLVCHASAGRLHWFVSGGDVTETVREMIGSGFVVIESRGAVRFDPAIPPEAGVVALRERLRAALDPDRMLTLGGA